MPFGPGGGVDIAARILADYFQQNYNITINVVNKPGGAQAIGINEMLRARPDGYTLAFPGFSALATTPKLTNVGYTLKNIKPVAHIASMECVLSTNKSSGIDTWEKFLQAAEKNPDGTVYGTTGSISTQRLYMTKLTDRFHGDLKIRHTAYTSGHEVSTALLGKHITAGFQVPANILPYANSGDFNVIAISRKERRADLPNTPTFRELYADKMTPADEKWIDLGAWHGLVVSSKVKDDRIAALEPLIEKAMKDPEVIEKFNKIGLDAGYLPAKEFGQLIQSSSDLADEVLAGASRLTNRILGGARVRPALPFHDEGSLHEKQDGFLHRLDAARLLLRHGIRDTFDPGNPRARFLLGGFVPHGCHDRAGPALAHPCGKDDHRQRQRHGLLARKEARRQSGADGRVDPGLCGRLHFPRRVRL